MLSLLVRELWQGLAAEEAQHVGVDIKYRGGAGYVGPQFGERGSVIISYASFCSFKITFSPRTHQNKKEEVILSRSRDPMTVSKHHVHTSFHWTYFHRSGIRPVIPPTQMMKTIPLPKQAWTQHSRPSCRLNGGLLAKLLSTAHCLRSMD